MPDKLTAGTQRGKGKTLVADGNLRSGLVTLFADE